MSQWLEDLDKRRTNTEPPKDEHLPGRPPPPLWALATKSPLYRLRDPLDSPGRKRGVRKGVSHKLLGSRLLVSAQPNPQIAMITAHNVGFTHLCPGETPIFGGDGRLSAQQAQRLPSLGTGTTPARLRPGLA